MTLEEAETTNYKTREFDLKSNDWLNIVTDETLTDCKPEYALLDLLKNGLDLDLEYCTSLNYSEPALVWRFGFKVKLSLPF